MKQALEGVRVLDLSRVICGPFCAAMLADMGAEVIKVEGHGDAQDSMRLSEEEIMVNGVPLLFVGLNRGKKAITINLKTDKGKDLFKELVRKSDVVIENFRPGVMDRLGLSYSTLREINPRLIYLSITGFGLGSPYERLPAYDLIAQAMAGLMSVTGNEDGPPTRVGSSISDLTTGIYSAFAICAALQARQTHGMGQFLEISLLDSTFSLLDIPLYIYLATGRVCLRIGSADQSVYPFDLFRAADGYFALAAYDPITFRRFCEAINRQDLLSSDKYSGYGSRHRYRGELKEIVETWALNRTVEDVLDTFGKANVPAGPVLNIQQIAESEHVRAREMLVEVDDPVAGKVRIPACPIKMSETPVRVSSSAPQPGQDSEMILQRVLGLDEYAIQQLKAEGII